MNVVCIGGGPAGLLAAALIARDHPSWTVSLSERRPREAGGGLGIVLSQAALSILEREDAPSGARARDLLWRWRDLRISVEGRATLARGHAFAALDRAALLSVLRARCEEVGVDLSHGAEVEDPSEVIRGADLVVAADGAQSRTREAFAADFGAHTRAGESRYLWLAAPVSLGAFSFWFRRGRGGVVSAHAYPYGPGISAVIAECGEDAWRRAGLDRAPLADARAYLEELFSRELGGSPLRGGDGGWRRFLSVWVRRLRGGRVALLGDAAHAAHFSIGSGTGLALADAAALAQALRETEDVDAALDRYEGERLPRVCRFREAAVASARFFERADAQAARPARSLAYRLLTRSHRVTHRDLEERDPALARAEEAELWPAASAAAGGRMGGDRPAAFAAPLSIAGLELKNRLVDVRAADVAPRARPAGSERLEPGLVIVEVKLSRGAHEAIPPAPAQVEGGRAGLRLRSAASPRELEGALSRAARAARAAGYAHLELDFEDDSEPGGEGGSAPPPEALDPAELAAALRRWWPRPGTTGAAFSAPAAGAAAAPIEERALAAARAGCDVIAMRGDGAAALSALERVRDEAGAAACAEIDDEPGAVAETWLVAGRVDLVARGPSR